MCDWTTVKGSGSSRLPRLRIAGQQASYREYEHDIELGDFLVYGRFEESDNDSWSWILSFKHWFLIF